MREDAFSQIIGRSSSIVGQIEKARAYATSHLPVMIIGETGTGKEVFASAIHRAALQRKSPFIPVNCAALPPDLVENEFFGHAVGAFTGATRAHKGFVEQAHSGTLFLDEVDSLSLAAQAKFLRFAQKQEYQPLGSEQTRRASVRIISATNANLVELVRANRFREDLYYRLCVLILVLPPLRDRREDIPLLANHILLRPATDGFELGARSNNPGHHSSSRAQAEASRSSGFTQAAFEKLAGYDWPGNVRELENVIQRAMVCAAGNSLDAQHLDFSTISPAAPVPPPTVDWHLTNPQPSSNGHKTESYKIQKARAVSDFEEQFLRRALEEHGGNITKAAKAAGKDRRTFAQLLAKHHLTHNHWPRDARETEPMDSPTRIPTPGNSSDKCNRLGRREFGRPDRLP